MKKTIELVIIAVLLTSSLFSLFLTIFSNYTVKTGFYIGLSVIIIISLLRIKWTRLSNYLLGLVILLGVFNLVAFSPLSYSFSISLWGLDMPGINPILLVIFFFYMAVNGKEINNLLGGTEMTPEQKEEDNEKTIRMYEAQYANKTLEELEDMVNNPDRYVDHAVIAARRLLDSKNVP